MIVPKPHARQRHSPTPSASIDAGSTELKGKITQARKPQAPPWLTIRVRRYTSEVLVIHIHLAPTRHKRVRLNGSDKSLLCDDPEANCLCHAVAGLSPTVGVHFD